VISTHSRRFGRVAQHESIKNALPVFHVVEGVMPFDVQAQVRFFKGFSSLSVSISNH
jgi:hypothetical protein